MNNLGDYPGKKTSGFLKQWQSFIYFRFFLRSNCKSDFWRVHWLRSQVWEVDPDPTNWQSSAPPPVLTFNLITISEPFWGFGVKIAICTSQCNTISIFLAALAALYLTLVSQWVTATLEFCHKKWLLRLETLQTFDQMDELRRKS